MIRNQQPAYNYGLQLLQHQQGPNQAGALGGVERAMQPIVAALLMKKGIAQQEAKDKDYSSALMNYQQGVQNELVPSAVNPTGPVQLGEDPSLRDTSGIVQRAAPGEAMANALMGVKNPDVVRDLQPMIMQQQMSDLSRADDRAMANSGMLANQRFQRGTQQNAQAYETGAREDQQAFTGEQNAAQMANAASIAAANRQNQADLANRPLTDQQLAQQTQLRAAGRPVTNVNTAQEKKFDEKVGEVQGERYAEIVKGADSARNKMQMLQALGPALADAPFTGAGAEALTNATMLMKQFGISEADTSGAELARSLTNQMTLMNRNPAGGAGMPGAMSDADREFLKSTVPGLSNTAGGAQKMVDLALKLEQRKVEVADIAQQYIEANGKLDSGFDKAVKAYAEKNPLFAPAQGGGGQGPVRVSTPEEAMKLAPGTLFVTPDGRTKVR